MSAPPYLALKKPKVETNDANEVRQQQQQQQQQKLVSSSSTATTRTTKSNNMDDDDKNDNNNSDNGVSREEQEEALVALIEHRTKEVLTNKQRIAYYKSQLEESEKRLHDSKSKLARLRTQSNGLSSKGAAENGTKNLKVERRSTSPIHISEDSSRHQPQSKPELLIPSVNPKVSQHMNSAKFGAKPSNGSSTQSGPSVSTQSYSAMRVKGDKPSRVSTEPEEEVKIQDKGTKRKFEQKEHKDLITSISSRSSPCIVRCHASTHISSQHKRKLRSLALCPVNDQLFVTSALDGLVNLWQVQSRGSIASLLSSTECLSPKQRRWPEDIAWHPHGNSLFSVYSADGGDSQISVLNLNKTQGRARVNFLEEKPHFKGIINGITFMPWEDVCFVTGGSDHAVILWSEKDGEDSWKPKALHRNLHSSAVMGVAGMQKKPIVLSAGADKRIIGFDTLVGRADYRHQIECKCMSVLPNPCDFNLFMVQTAAPERQLRLFDIRLRQTEIHAFGWRQESSESQSALINQAWSPDGFYITSGSADPMIHVFDIRYNSRKPSQSIKAHQKRVFKAVWLHSVPLLVSISSDLNIGLHKMT
ncbi:uncharacterized protein LOC115964072 [Quercus lobata]|uniref:uncharacterized protein LOC115964072 n=1 Tax=Quercus lobata TaxID=97700 RepID=UPI001248BABC|nr:uncharacterized protein LOC115964072 [Quercus lobata]